MSPVRLDFVIGGAQKAGTSSLANYLGQHPQVRLPVNKEAHVFDAPDLKDSELLKSADRRYGELFGAAESGVIYGDATPIYMLHPVFIARAARYAPGLKWLVLLRHPVSRAVSNFHMEADWGREKRSLWMALALERLRMRGHENDFSMDSPLRRCNYVGRGDYALQLDALLAHFPAQQILLIDNEQMATDPAQVYRRVCRFLRLEPTDPLPAFKRMLVGDYPEVRPGSWRWHALRLWMRGELGRAKHRYGIDWDATPGLRVPEHPALPSSAGSS